MAAGGVSTLVRTRTGVYQHRDDRGRITGRQARLPHTDGECDCEVDKREVRVNGLGRLVEVTPRRPWWRRLVEAVS